MKTRSRSFGFVVFAVVILATSVAPHSSMAANGDDYDFSMGQRENGQDLTPVDKTVKKYEDKTAATCYQGANWCTKTGTTKLMHWHNVDTDLTAQQKARANTYIEYHSSQDWIDDDYRFDDASILKTCHSWALGTTEHLVGPDQLLKLANEYTEVDEEEATEWDLGQCQDNHTCKVEDLDPETGVRLVRSKVGFYGYYECHPDDCYGGVVQYWH